LVWGWDRRDMVVLGWVGGQRKKGGNGGGGCAQCHIVKNEGVTGGTDSVERTSSAKGLYVALLKFGKWWRGGYSHLMGGKMWDKV